MFRITGVKGKRTDINSDRAPLLLMNGAFGSALDWPLPGQLAEQGYDVWIGNNRGTMYSWDHKSLNCATDNAFWDYTWADMGLYDDTANITAIKEATGVDKVFYIGYSQGTI